MNKTKLFKFFMFLGILLIITLGYLRTNLILDNKALQNKIYDVKNDTSYIQLNNIDKKFLTSIIATEDHRFYNHGAIDIISIVRSTFKNIQAKKIVQGGSTITQQLAKNLYLSNEKSFSRKFKELLLAIELEKNYSKNELLELYVNIIPFGNGYIGIKQASNGYFKKTPKNLSFNEATSLAGLPQAPHIYSLDKNISLAKKRQLQVINALKRYKEIHKSTAVIRHFFIVSTKNLAKTNNSNIPSILLSLLSN